MKNCSNQEKSMINNREMEKRLMHKTKNKPIGNYG
jgi:hypothetical protein